MKIVIDIDEDVFTKLFDNGTEDYAIVNDDLFTIAKSIRKGTPLLKGYGRLIDSELLDKRLSFVLNHTGGYKNTEIGTGIVIAMAENLDAPTVIEADKENTDGSNNN